MTHRQNMNLFQVKFLSDTLLFTQRYAVPHNAAGRASDLESQSGHVALGIDHGLFFAAILLLPLIQEGHLSVIGEGICTWYLLTRS